ncbi:MAG: hypothetical protein ACKVWV_13655 [Planctomycetota bacterium]
MEHALPYLTTVGSVAAFAFSAWKYLDTRRLEARTKRFDQSHRVFTWVAGRTQQGQTVVDLQQAVAVYQLAEFPEFSHMTLPILSYLSERDEMMRHPLFNRAVTETIERLRRPI